MLTPYTKGQQMPSTIPNFEYGVASNYAKSLSLREDIVVSCRVKRTMNTASNKESMLLPMLSSSAPYQYTYSHIHKDIDSQG